MTYFELASFLSLADETSNGERGSSEDIPAIDPRRDVRSVSYYRDDTRASSDGVSWGVVLKGRFDRQKIVAVVEQSGSLSRAHVGPVTLYVFRDSGGRFAMAFPDATTALFGSPRQIRSMLATRSGRQKSLAGGQLGRWLSHSVSADYFVAVSSADGPIESFSLRGELTGHVVRVVARALATDDGAAEQLAGVAKGVFEAARLSNRVDTFDVGVAGRELEASYSASYRTLRGATGRR